MRFDHYNCQIEYQFPNWRRENEREKDENLFMSMWLFCGTHIFRPSQFHRWNFTRNVRIVGIRLIVFFAVAIFVSSNYPFCSFGAGVCITDSLNWRKDKINGVQSYVVLSQSKLRNKIEIDETQEISNFIHGFVLGCNLYVCFGTFLSFFSVGLAWHRYSSQPFIRPSNIINAMVFPLACTIFGGTKKKKAKKWTRALTNERSSTKATLVQWKNKRTR